MPKNSMITIQAFTGTQDSAGEPISDWAAIPDGTVWADIRDVSGREFVAAGADQARVTTRIRIWRRDEVAPTMRILHGRVVYEIHAALLEGQDTTLLMCSRRQP